VPAGTNPFGLAISANGKSVYVTNANSDSVSQYSVGARGALSPKSQATVVTDDMPVGVAVNPPVRIPTDKQQCKHGWRNFPQFKEPR
jgi:DNA-binding beta-propeller fold protein YncE